MENEKTLLAVLDKKPVSPPPVWMMRQAGRYLPEYRELRTKAGSFWNLCMTPKWAAEAALQPISRFGFDAAIIFSDILVVPAALGLAVEFEDGGPKLKPVSASDIPSGFTHEGTRLLEPVYEALELARCSLASTTALLGFAGAPWTLASYMAAGGGGDEQKAAKLWAYRDPESFERLMDVLVECVARHLIGQLKAGADAVQIFDSWASGLTPTAFARWVIAPTKKIVEKVRVAVPQAKIIGFPRGATLAGYELYAGTTGVDAISLDTSVPMDWAVQNLRSKVALQGNLDPLALIAGGDALKSGVDDILNLSVGTPFIFNLGHGILPETPLHHVEEMIERVRKSR